MLIQDKEILLVECAYDETLIELANDFELQELFFLEVSLHLIFFLLLKFIH